MTWKALALVLGSAFIHASWNAILKRCREPEHAVMGGSIVSAIVAVLIGLASGIGVGHGHALVWAAVAGVLEAAYFQTLARALGRGTLGTVYTVSRGGALLVVWPISIVLLAEKMTLPRGVGTGFVLLGLAAVGFGQPKDQTKTESGFALAALTGVFIGGYNIAYKLALGDGVLPSTANAVSLGLAALINVALVGSARRKSAWNAFREAPAAITFAGFLGATGFLLFLAALSYVGAGVIVTLRNTSILFAQVMGLFLGERPTRVALLGALVVTLGAVFLAL